MMPDSHPVDTDCAWRCRKRDTLGSSGQRRDPRIYCSIGCRPGWGVAPLTEGACLLLPRSIHPQRREWQVSAASDGGTPGQGQQLAGDRRVLGRRGVSGRPQTPAGLREQSSGYPAPGPGELAGPLEALTEVSGDRSPLTLRGPGFFPGGGGGGSLDCIGGFLSGSEGTCSVVGGRGLRARGTGPGGPELAAVQPAAPPRWRSGPRGSCGSSVPTLGPRETVPRSLSRLAPDSYSGRFPDQSSVLRVRQE